MRFATIDGIVFEFRIVGYAQPNNSRDAWDSNWLIIEGAVQHPRGNWKFRDPSLLTPEVVFLADWFEAVGGGVENEQDFRTLDHNLHFELISVNGVRTMRVILDGSLRPPWAEPGCEIFIDFPVAGLRLASASDSLREQLKRHNYKRRSKLDMYKKGAVLNASLIREWR